MKTGATATGSYTSTSSPRAERFRRADLARVTRTFGFVPRDFDFFARFEPDRPDDARFDFVARFDPDRPDDVRFDFFAGGVAFFVLPRPRVVDPPSPRAIVTCAAASRAIGTRNGLHDT